MKKRSFFTLLEVLVSMGVFMLLMLALMQFFTVAQNAWERSDGKAQMFDSARIAMDCLVNDLSCAFYAEDFKNTTFMKYSKTTDETTIAFATNRSNGLTLVRYKYDPAKKELTIQELTKDKCADKNNWISCDNDKWQDEFSSQKPTPSELADHVIDFSLEKYKKNPESDPDSIGTDLKIPPYLLSVKMTVINERTKKILEAMKITDYKNQAGWTDEQKDIYSQGTQTFERAVIINRGQY